jgi:cephalosporin-C deacetylase-like acetyl esterase
MGHEKFSNSKSISWHKSCFTGITSSFEGYSERLKKRGFKNTVREIDFNNFKENLECHVFSYDVGGIEVKGYFVKPKHIQGKLPVIIYNRGGNDSPRHALNFSSVYNRLFPIANEGYIIIASQYRGVGASMTQKKKQIWVKMNLGEKMWRMCSHYSLLLMA